MLFPPDTELSCTALVPNAVFVETELVPLPTVSPFMVASAVPVIVPVIDKPFWLKVPIILVPNIKFKSLAVELFTPLEINRFADEPTLIARLATVPVFLAVIVALESALASMVEAGVVVFTPKLPVTLAPVEVVSNFLLLSKYKALEPSSVNVAKTSLPAAFISCTKLVCLNQNLL